MSTPKECPKCKSEDIDNVFELSDLFGISEEYKDYKKWFCQNCTYNFGDDEVVPWYNGQDFSKMKLSQIADIIIDDWSDITPYARPYIEAMANIDDINDSYGSDDATSVISYFLSNAQKWRGATAKKIKTHLKKLVDDYYKNKK